ncbi:MAG: hypothetical protein RJA70_2427 [Pseudomonadota bacterium]
MAPQTTLTNVRALVDACDTAAPSSSSALTELTNLSARHVNYAGQAAAMLGFVEADSGSYSLTPRGKDLARSLPGTEAERRLLADSVETSPAFKRLVPNLLSSETPAISKLVSNIQRLTGLAKGTAEHRAAMLLNWRKRLVQPEFEFESRNMWRRVEIKNFRSIEHAKVDLAPFTMVVGANGSGKSNFVDALVFLRDIAGDASVAVATRGGISGLRRWTKKKPTDVTIDVRAATSRDALEKNFVRHLAKLHSGKDGAWSFSQEVIEVVPQGKKPLRVERKKNATGGTSQVTGEFLPTTSVMVTAKQLKSFATTQPLRNVFCYRLNPETMRKPQDRTDNARLSETGVNIATAINSLTDKERAQAIVRPLERIVPGLKDVYAEQVGRLLALRFKQTLGDEVAEFYAADMSEGALRALGIIIATHQMQRDELLIIEEPEVALHVGAATLLFDLLKEASERGAVLVTTHSADLLDAASDEEILVCKYSEGTTKIGPLAEAQRKIVRDGLFSVAELMRTKPLRIEGE